MNYLGRAEWEVVLFNVAGVSFGSLIVANSVSMWEFVRFLALADYLMSAGYAFLAAAGFLAVQHRSVERPRERWLWRLSIACGWLGALCVAVAALATTHFRASTVLYVAIGAVMLTGVTCLRALQPRSQMWAAIRTSRSVVGQMAERKRQLSFRF